MTDTLNKAGDQRSTNMVHKDSLIPNFLVIGAGKSGTTSLDKYLKQHPEIFIPDVKEPNFFGYETTTLADLNGDPAEIQHYRNSITSLDEYLNLFRAAAPNQLKGETSNTYMYHKDAPARIHFYNPRMKLIAILRQPASRLYSRYLHLAREQRLPTRDFSECRDQTSIWWRRNDLIKEGFYFNNLSPFYRLFPREQIRIFLYEELSHHPEIVLANIFEFLGVDPNFKPDLSVRYNESGLIRNKFLDRIYGHKGIVNRTVKSLLPDMLVEKLKNSLTVQRTMSDLRRKNLIRPKMEPEMRRWLTHDVYGDDIRQLQKLIGRDLSHWLR